MELIGWVGSFLLTFCGVPMAWQSFKEGHSTGVNMIFLQMWLWGEVFTLIYVAAQPELLIPLIANYIFNIIMILVILKYKYFPTVNVACELD